MALTQVQPGMLGTPQPYAFKNRIINGAMVLDQRNAGASVSTGTTGAATYSLDRWLYFVSAATKFTIQQNAGSVTPPVGFSNYLGVTSTAATSVGSTDYYLVGQRIEGYNFSDLGWGTADAKTVTLSFWVRSSLTGTFPAFLASGLAATSYPFSYTISSANTWTQISVTIPGAVSSSWGTTNNIGLQVYFTMGAGSSFQGTANTWNYSNAYYTVSGATNIVATNGATWYVTGVQLEVGVTATTFDYRPYGTELQLCQRYYSKFTNVPYSGIFSGIMYNTVLFLGPYQYTVPMRAAPTLSYSAFSDFAVIASNNGIQPTAISFDSASPTCARVNISIGTGLTAGDGAYMQSQNTNAWLAMSAEL